MFLSSAWYLRTPLCSKPLPYLSHTSLQNPDIRWFCCLQYLETNHSYISQLYSIQSAPYSPVALTALPSVGQEAVAYKNSHSHQREPQRGEREGRTQATAGQPPLPFSPPLLLLNTPFCSSFIFTPLAVYFLLPHQATHRVPHMATLEGCEGIFRH